MASCSQWSGEVAALKAAALMAACCLGIDSGDIDNGTRNGGRFGDHLVVVGKFSDCIQVTKMYLS